MATAFASHAPAPDHDHLADFEVYLERLVAWLQRTLGADLRGANQTTDIALPPAPALVTKIGDRLGLSNEASSLLALAVAPHYEPRVARLYGQACGAARAMCFHEAVLGRLLGCSLARVRRRFGALLGARGPLLGMKLLHERADGLAETPVLRSLLLDAGHDLPSSWTFASLHPPRLGRLELTDATERELNRLAVRWSETRQPPVTVIVGASGTGRTLCACHLATARGLAVLEIDLDRAPESLDALELVREARLHGAAVLLTTTRPSLAPAWRDRVEQLVEHGESLLVEMGEDASAATVHGERLVLRLTRPDREVRERLWARCLPAHLRDDALDDRTLATRFRGTGRDIAELAADALDSRDDDTAPVGLATLARLSRRRGEMAMRSLATCLAPLDGGLGRVLLPETQRTAVDEILARVRCRHQVLDRWGFGRRLDYGLGTIALLSGPPGTGKTLSARAIATELDVPLFRVDLSAIVSKWLGETEKHLGALFDAAEASGAALLFDEADALFARRTEVNTSNDRHANLEVGYLLQRIESFDGLCFLTTNMTRSIDPAFLRRVSVHIQYELPDAELRALLWRELLPTDAPLDDDIDFDGLAECFEGLSAADIRAAVLRAAFIAAARGSGIDHDLLWEAGREELRATGTLVRELDDGASWPR